MIFASRRLTAQIPYLWPPSRTIKTIYEISRKSMNIENKSIKIKATPTKNNEQSIEKKKKQLTKDKKTNN